MILETFPVGLLQCNCTVLGCETTGRALVIDPGDDAEIILNILERNKLSLEAILHTHAHLDHVGATSALAVATGASVMLHPADQYLYDHVEMQARMFGFPVPETMPVDRHVTDGETITVGRLEGEVMHTPGHTPGSLCLRMMGNGDGESPGRVFAGDTLFLGSIGRTDLWGGNMDRILISIRDRLLTLPDEMVVIPGHGPATTIGDERHTNPFLQS
jgi:glyoxylase-like metal-dependent hydrolase (beta-lactamase superfamily II)